MTCAIYCRLSKEDLGADARESESIQNQKAMLVHYAVTQGWKIFAIYCDDDSSGADSQRPQWNDMLRAAQAGSFELILCKNQSRFTRDLAVVEQYIHGLFPLWGIRFVALLDNADTAVAGNKKSRQINGLINEWYLEDLSQNIRAVLDSKRRAGKFIGSAPAFGYRKDPADHNHLLVDEVAAQVVRRIFALYLGGLGTHAIASLLEAEGVPSPGAYRAGPGAPGVWSHTAVSRILRSPLYTGDLIQGRKRKASYKSKQLLSVDPADWVTVADTHQAIIDRETFNAVQRRLSGRVRSDGTGVTHLLAGKVRCLDCGSTMHRLSHTYKGRTKSYLQCKRYGANRKNPICTGHTLRLDLLTALVEERLRAHAAGYRPNLTRFRLPDSGEAESPRLRRELLVLGQQDAKLAAAIKALYLDKVEGLVSADQFRQLSGDLAADRETLALRIAAKTADLSHLANAPPDNLAAKIEALLRLTPPPRTLIDLAIDSIEVGEKSTDTQKIIIHWRF